MYTNQTVLIYIFFRSLTTNIITKITMNSCWINDKCAHFAKINNKIKMKYDAILLLHGLGISNGKNIVFHTRINRFYSSSASNLVFPMVRESSFGQKPPSSSVIRCLLFQHFHPFNSSFLNILLNLFFPSLSQVTSWSLPSQSILQCLSWYPSSIHPFNVAIPSYFTIFYFILYFIQFQNFSYFSVLYPTSPGFSNHVS